MPRGRKRKPGNRYPCGRRTRIETEREAMATVIEARRRHFGVTEKQARDERLATSLGRLAWKRDISPEQYEAGIRFGELYHRHHLILGLPVPSPSSVAGLLIAEGIFGGSRTDPDPDVVETVRDRFDTAMRALADSDREQRLARGAKPSQLVYRVVCVDEDTRQWPECDLGNFRVALNALVRVFRC